MKQFEIHGTFYAESIDDAIDRLGRHFTNLFDDDAEPAFDEPFKIEVKPKGE